MKAKLTFISTVLTLAGLTNIANTVWTTQQAVQKIESAK